MDLLYRLHVHTDHIRSPCFTIKKINPAPDAIKATFLGKQHSKHLIIHTKENNPFFPFPFSLKDAATRSA